MINNEFLKLLSENIGFKQNAYHPLVWINGNPKIGEGTTIGFFSEVNAKNAEILIGRHCDIASFVAINAADSHRRCIGLQSGIKRVVTIINDDDRWAENFSIARRLLEEANIVLDHYGNA